MTRSRAVAIPCTDLAQCPLSAIIVARSETTRTDSCRAIDTISGWDIVVGACLLPNCHGNYEATITN